MGRVLTFRADRTIAATARPSQGQLRAARALAGAGHELRRAGKYEEIEPDARLLGCSSTGVFSGGGAIAAVLVVLCILRLGPVEPDAAAASVVPVLAPGWVGVQGTF